MTTPDSIAGFPFCELEFGTQGEPLFAAQTDRLIAESKRNRATDLIFLAHGFRCDAAEATALYTGLLTNLRASLAAPDNRTFVAAGVYWPSQEFRESFGTTESVRSGLAGLRGVTHNRGALDRAESLLDAVAVSRGARNRFVASVLTAFDDGRDDPAEGLPLLHRMPGSDLIDELRAPLANSVLGGVDTFLNLMSWTAMKNLSGQVGANGLASSVLACQHELSASRIHLVGHSLGGRLVTACCKMLGQRRAAQVDSLSLLEAAFSHFGFSPDAGRGQPGFFRSVIENQIVRGPMISTFSKQDEVVGKVYALASRLSRDRLQAIGDSSDPYGGIGHNGAQRTPESVAIPLHPAAQPYRFQPGIVTCLDGSAGPGSAGLITSHGDVTNPHVTCAIASAIRGAD